MFCAQDRLRVLRNLLKLARIPRVFNRSHVKNLHGIGQTPRGQYVMFTVWNRTVHEKTVQLPRSADAFTICITNAFLPSFCREPSLQSLLSRQKEHTIIHQRVCASPAACQNPSLGPRRLDNQRSTTNRFRPNTVSEGMGSAMRSMEPAHITIRKFRPGGY